MRILYVEDNPGDARLLEVELSESMPLAEMEWAATCEEAREKIAHCTPDSPLYDLILADMQLPDGKGVSLLPFLQERRLQIPLVVVTGLEDEASAISALKSGACDYIIKTDRYLAELPGIIKQAVVTYRMEVTRHAKPICVLYGTTNVKDIEATRIHFSVYAPFIQLDIVTSARAVLENLLPPAAKGENNGKSSWDVVIFDAQLSDMTPLEFLREMRTTRKVDVPVVVMSGDSKYELAIQAFRSGADDYVIKTPGYLYHLPNVLENAFNRVQVEREKAALKKSEEHFRMLIENSHDIIVVTDPSGTITYASPSIERVFGFKMERLLGRKLFETIHPDDLDKAKEKYAEAVLSRDVTVGPVEIRFSRVDGSWRWVEAFGKVVTDRTGEVAVVLNGRDVTERKAAEQALLNSQSRLSEAMEIGQLVPWEADPVDNQFIFNDTFYSFMKTTAAKEGGYRMSVRDYEERFVHPGDREVYYQHLAENRHGTKDFSQIERRIITREGDIRHVLVRVRFIKDESGNVTQVRGTIQDITDRVRMETALLESESKYRSLVENPFVGVFITQNNLIRFANKRFCEIIGYPTDEIVDRIDGSSLIHPGDKELWDESYRRFRKDRVSLKQDIRILRKDGKTTMLKVFLSPIAYQGKQAAAGMIIDTTQERSLEDQLRQAQKMEAIGTLAGGIAHDFNNILTALTGYCSLLKMEMEGGKKASMPYVDAILSSSLKAANLTQGLLAFARKQTVSLKPVSINDIVRSMEKILRRLLTEDIVLKKKLCSQNTVALADESQIDQILMNLAVNARDAMPDGGTITLTTRTAELDKSFADLYGLEGPGQYVVFSVSDTGVGMDEMTKEHIFEPFYTTKDVGKGTGLGLATVYGIVKQHNGGVVVYSEKGMGSTFHIYLPAVGDQAEEEKQMPALVGGSETILLAEDNDDVRISLTALLTQFGYSVIQAVDGQDAVDHFNARIGQIDLLLFDSVMPKKNGRQAYDEIAAIQPSIKVIFMSGYTSDVVLDKGVEEKGFNFIAKPVQHDILFRKVREVLDSLP